MTGFLIRYAAGLATLPLAFTAWICFVEWTRKPWA